MTDTNSNPNTKCFLIDHQETYSGTISVEADSAEAALERFNAWLATSADFGDYLSSVIEMTDSKQVIKEGQSKDGTLVPLSNVDLHCNPSFAKD